MGISKMQIKERDNEEGKALIGTLQLDLLTAIACVHKVKHQPQSQEGSGSG